MIRPRHAMLLMSLAAMMGGGLSDRPWSGLRKTNFEGVGVRILTKADIAAIERANDKRWRRLSQQFPPQVDGLLFRPAEGSSEMLVVELGGQTIGALKETAQGVSASLRHLSLLWDTAPDAYFSSLAHAMAYIRTQLNSLCR